MMVNMGYPKIVLNILKTIFGYPTFSTVYLVCYWSYGCLASVLLSTMLGLVVTVVVVAVVAVAVAVAVVVVVVVVVVSTLDYAA